MMVAVIATTMMTTTIILSLSDLQISSAASPASRRTSNSSSSKGIDPIGTLHGVSPPKPAGDMHSKIHHGQGMEETRADEEAAVVPAIIKEPVETCRGYYDVMGQWDAPFDCRTKPYTHCCGTCGFRFCCQYLREKLDQRSCNNYDSPGWADVEQHLGAGDAPGTFPHDKHYPQQAVVLAACGVGALLVVAAVFAGIGLRKLAAQREIGRASRLSEIVQREGQLGMQRAGPEEERATAAATTTSAEFACETSTLGTAVYGGAAFFVQNALAGQHSPHHPPSAMPPMPPLSVPTIETLLASPKRRRHSVSSMNSLDDDDDSRCRHEGRRSERTAGRHPVIQALPRAPHPHRHQQAACGTPCKLRMTKMYSDPGGFRWQDSSAGAQPPQDPRWQGRRSTTVDHSTQQLNRGPTRTYHSTYSKREVVV
ncbi:protein shisa-6-like [Lethenteron reissneri]|uniref:protein shisa-6-like n=1 Tax=Lethenteron reissneri TaxID=7753 RepID=UPI002AB6C946|nr:protein shisa-6-like [Lethenteron reissneri]